MVAGVAVIAILFECALIYNRKLVYRTFVAFYDGQMTVYGPMANALAHNRRRVEERSARDCRESGSKGRLSLSDGDKYERAARQS